MRVEVGILNDAPLKQSLVRVVTPLFPPSCY